MKKISLIVPVYNGEEYLETMARSVLSQEWTNLQVIFSDDGSTDRSREILNRLASEDARVAVVTGENRGVSSARNRALSMADGDYIGFADSDDLLEPGYLNILAELLEEYDADVACCGFTRVYETTGKSDRMPPRADSIQTVDRYGFRALLLRPDGYTTVMWNKLFRRKALLDEAGELIRFDESLHIVEDGEYLFRLPVQRAVFTPEPFYRYFVRTTGAMYGVLNERKLTELDARRKIVDLCDGSPEEIRELSKMKYQKGVRDLMLHAVIGGQGRQVRHLRGQLDVFRRELYRSPHLSKKEKLKYRVYRPLIQLNLRRLSAFLMKKLSGH